MIDSKLISIAMTSEQRALVISNATIEQIALLEKRSLSAAERDMLSVRKAELQNAQ